MNKHGILNALKVKFENYQFVREKAQIEKSLEEAKSFLVKEKTMHEVICFLQQNMDDSRDIAIKFGAGTVVIKKHIIGWTWINKDNNCYYFNIITTGEPIKVELIPIESETKRDILKEAQELYEHITTVLNQEFIIVE